MALKIYFNVGTSDVEYGTSGSEWIEYSAGNDKLIPSGGSDTVADGESLPSESDLIQAGVVLTGSEQTVGHYFLYDASANLLREIHNMGNQNKRYVVAFVFDAATSSEPVLEFWDTSAHDTITGTMLGAGTPSLSWWKGITTTDSAPGAGWTGSPLAGSGVGNFLLLNDGDGPLTGADVLYCNLKLIIPATVVTAGSGVPIFTVKYQ